MERKNKLMKWASEEIQNKFFKYILNLDAGLTEVQSVKGIYPAPDIHEQFMIHNGYGTLRITSRTNFNNPERTVTNCMNITMHTDVNTA